MSKRIFSRLLLIGGLVALVPIAGFLVDAQSMRLLLGEEPINYDEAKVPPYKLPDLLTTFNGRQVTTAEDWWTQRRPELLEAFAREIYGYTPERVLPMAIEPIEQDRQALNGMAIRKQVRLLFSDDRHRVHVDVLLYLPRQVSGPVPVFLAPNFHGNHTVHANPAIRLPEGWVKSRYEGEDHRPSEHYRGASPRWPVERILARGYGLVTFYYGDVEPDHDGGYKKGVRPLFYRTGQTAPAAEDWRAIGVWAWGMSRVLDYLETDPDVDASRVALQGHSRLGKTALWAGAQDQRFALVISNNSGALGASLTRRNFGETLAKISDFSRWFVPGITAYKRDVTALPVDQHMLIALIAPRPVYIASAEDDLWADPKGEFLAAKAAEPAYRLLGAGGMAAEVQPAVEQPVTSVIGYHLRRGGHDVTTYDWERYLDFADRHLQPAP